MPTTKPKRKTMAQLGYAINKHLTRIEADPKLNKVRKQGGMTNQMFYCASAGNSGNRIYVVYVSYQGKTGLTREDAEKYLAALDAGKVARHFEVLMETKKK